MQILFTILIDLKMSLEKIRTEMYEKTLEYLEEPNPPSSYFLNNSFPGSGKSYLTCKALDDCDSVFIYLVNEHDVGSEQMETNKVLFNLTQIKSRYKLCKHETYKNLSEKGINIKRFCPTCEYIGACEYYHRMIEIWKERQSWIGVHHHLPGLVNNYIDKKHPDALVIDEYFLNGIWKNLKIFYGTLISNITLVSKMEDTNERTFILDVLREFSITFKTNRLNIDFIHERIYKYFRRYGTPFDLELFYNEFEERLSNMYFNTGKIFVNIVTRVCKMLYYLYRHHKTVKDPTYLDLMSNVILYIKGDEKQYIDISYVDLGLLDLNCKIIILDATTPKEFYEHIFKKQIYSLQNSMVVNSKIYQVTSAKYCMSTLDNEKSDIYKRLKNIVRDIANKHKTNVLVVSRKKYEKDILFLNPNINTKNDWEKLKRKEITPEYIYTGHYPLFGSNKYEKFNVCVLFGTPEPQRDMLKRRANLLDIDCKILYYLEREAYMLQSLHRIRCNIKEEPTYIYILSSVDLDLKNANKLSIGKLERLIRNQVVGYVSEDNESRIEEEVLSYLRITELPLSELYGLITGNSVIVADVIKNMEIKRLIDIYKLHRSGRGRKPLICRLPISDNLEKV
jgi:hypothetical protein